MARPYKYRVWNGREMVSPDYIDRQGFAHWREDSIQCVSQKITQFIGVIDKNGKEIYDGDIVKDGLDIHVVKYDADIITQYGHGDSSTTKHVGYTFWFHGSDIGDIEVIGNVYANPELLKP